MRAIPITAILTLAAFFLGFKLVYESIPDPSADYTWSTPKSSSLPESTAFLNPAPERETDKEDSDGKSSPQKIEPPLKETAEESDVSTEDEDAVTVASVPDEKKAEDATANTDEVTDDNIETASLNVPVPGMPVTVYTTRPSILTNHVFQQFTENTGINVRVIPGTPSAFPAYLKEKSSKEKNTARPDVLLAENVALLADSARSDLLTPLRSSHAEKHIPKALRDAKFRWYGLSKRLSVIFRHKEDKKSGTIAGFQSLTDTDFRNRILISPNAVNMISVSLTQEKNAAAGNRFIKGITANYSSDDNFQGSNQNDAARLREVASGNGKIAVAYINAYINLHHSGYAKDRAAADALDIIFPSRAYGGTQVNITGLGLVKGAPNPGGAKKLLEYLSSKEGQRVYAYANFEYPSVANVASFSELASLGTIPENTTAIRAMAQNTTNNKNIKKTP